jgi:hypothetical protein
MPVHRGIALAAIASVLSASSIAVAVAQTTDSTEQEVPESTQGNPCEGQQDEHRVLAKRAWDEGRWDWWTAHPPTRSEMRQADEVQDCALRVWRKQKEQFERFWEHNKLQGLSGWLRSTRYCESGSHGLYRANTGNGFFGAYQFDYTSWHAAGGNGTANNAPPREQDYRAIVWRGLAGTGAWPNCG